MIETQVLEIETFFNELSHKPVTMAGGRVVIEPGTYTSKSKVELDGYHLTTPPKSAFIEDLKQQLPWYARRWVPEKRVWWVSEPYLTPAVLDILGYWYDRRFLALLDEHRTKQKPAVELLGRVG